MQKVSILLGLTIGMACLFSSCSLTRYVPDDSLLLDRVKVKTDDQYHDISIGQMRNYLRQQPNARWFSLFRLPLATYSLSGRDTTKWMNRMLRSLGEPPVLYDSVLAAKTCSDLTQTLRNQGYMRADVDLQTVKHKKKIVTTYLLHPGEPYFIRNIRYEISDTVIARMLEAMGDSTRRLLYEGMKFDAERLDAERKRITAILADSGYYRFHKEFISYVADTAANSRLIDISLRLSLYHRKDLPDTLHPRYTMRNISYSSGDLNDSVIHLRRHVLEECTHLKSGKLFSSTHLQQTYNHFGRLQAVKYTNIAIKQVPDTTLLDCAIQLQTNKPSMISFQPEGTNTAGDLGAAASFTYQNRNLFRGSELLSLQVRGAYEAIRGLEGYSNQDFIEYSAEASLTFPRFIMPFLSRNLRHSLKASSEVSLLYDLQNRPEFHRRVLSATWRYRWSLPGRNDRFQFDVLDLNYVFMPWISQTFREEYLEGNTSRNAILRYNYEDLFITKIGLGYSFSNQHLALRTNIETSGNVLSLGANVFRAEKDDNGQYRLFNIAFAQYVKGDIDVTKSFQIDRNNQLVFHVGLGIAYPYGNSSVLPFEKRYFAGGANSVRGWSVRSLGPGGYKERDGRINFINQTGDMKLDLNAEYRTHLFWKLGGALFVDAGNIWTLRSYNEQPEGQFRFDTFASQIAVSYGLGLRFNFDYFILRFDLGMKAINPAFKTDEEEDHFPILHPRFSRDYAFHFAVGLPF